MKFIVAFCLFMIFSYATACDRCVHQSKADYFSSDSSLSVGKCGYGSLAPTFNGGFIAAGISSLYKNGSGCGACFQIRCKISDLCSTSGTKVILFDLNTDPNVDFVLSSKAFMAMAKPGKEQDVQKLGITDIEYKRIPCDQYKSGRLAVRVEDNSRNPCYLGIKVLYQAGQTEIKAIVIGGPNWSSMTRNDGALWDTSRVPNGPLQFRFLVTSDYEGKYIWAHKVLPVYWKPGTIYYTFVQITDIAQENCYPCDYSRWE